MFEDYATAPVPERKRFRWFSQGMVWSGGAFCLAAFSLGGLLASSMRFAAFLTAVFLGAVILTVLSCLTSFIGAKTHLTSTYHSRFTLGVVGGKIFGLILAVSLFGWFGYQCSYFASSAAAALELFGLPGGSPTVWAVVGGLAMMLTAVVGFSGITLLSIMGVPLLFLLVLLASAVTVRQVDFSMLRAAAQAGGSMSLSEGVVMVVGGFISGACITSDVSRFSKKPTDSTCGCILGFVVSFPIVLLLGGFFYYAYGTSDLCEVFITHCGLGLFAPFVLVISTWTTNDYNLYCSVLGTSNALDGHVRLPQWLLTLVVGGISTVLGALGIMDVFVSFLNLVGVLIPPVAAVIIADYYIYNRNSGLYSYENVNKLEGFRLNTCLSAAVGIGVGLLCNYGNIGLLNQLCSVIPACIAAMLASVAALVIYNTAAGFRAVP